MIRPILRRDRAPLGLVFGGIVSAAAFGVWLLGLDRLPITLCVFKGLTGLPCPTCGSTRMLGELASGDFLGALLVNPLATVGAAVLVVWAASDAVLAPTGRALALAVRADAAAPLRWAVAASVVLNWAWLIVTGV